MLRRRDQDCLASCVMSVYSGHDVSGTVALSSNLIGIYLIAVIIAVRLATCYPL